MAPRRKHTTAAARKGRSTRAKPKLPEGDLESSMTVEEKEDKLSVYIQDYEFQVKPKLDEMRKSCSTIKSLISNIYKNVVLKLPKNVKQMTMAEFLSKGGTVNAAINAQVTEICISGLLNSMPSKIPSDRLPLTGSNNVNITALHMDKTAQVSQTTSSVRTAGKVRPKRKVKDSDETAASKRPATVTRSSRRLQDKLSGVTPMPTIISQSVVQTPFVMPKFDPRLPITPAVVREPKAGERIMSMCGSPLANPAGPNVGTTVFIPVKGGKTIQLSVHDKSLTLHDLDVVNDDVALHNIQLLQEKLSMLLTMPKNFK